MPFDFNKAQVRFGQPGKLYVSALGVTEPSGFSSAWGAGWIPVGYTPNGSTFNYEVQVSPAYVEEELDPIGYGATGRVASVVFALAQTSFRNLTLWLNGGVMATGSGTDDSSDWSFEPPDLGTEKRIQLGWDANPIPANNELRFVFRQGLQGGTGSVPNNKGVTIAGLSTTFNLELPDSGKKLLKVMGSGKYNR
jgi:hypothetical protein